MKLAGSTQHSRRMCDTVPLLDANDACGLLLVRGQGMADRLEDGRRGTAGRGAESRVVTSATLSPVGCTEPFPP